LVIPAGSENGNVQSTAFPGTMFMILTHSMTGAFLQAEISTVNAGTYEMDDQVRDISISGSAGWDNKDAGCSACDGVEVLNWDGLTLKGFSEWGFGGNGIYIDINTSGGAALTNNIDFITLDRARFFNNGADGIRIGGNAVGVSNPGSFNMQDIVIEDESGTSGNANNGLNDLSNVAGLTVRDSFFADDAAVDATASEIYIQGQIQGGTIDSNYIETHGSHSPNGISVSTKNSPSTNLDQQLSITNNFIYSVNGAGNDGIVIGSSSWAIMGGMTINDNGIYGIWGACIATPGADLTDRGNGNRCNTAGTYYNLPAPFALTAANYACNSTYEGQEAVQTNSTAACSAGAVATTGGTTACQIYCDGTDWIQTGR
jgi:hypothetical protein